MDNQKSIKFKSEFSIVAHNNDSIELRSGVWNPTSFLLEDEKKSGTLFGIVRSLQLGADPASIAKEMNVRRSEVEAIVDVLIEAGIMAENQVGAFNELLDRQLNLRMLEEPRAVPIRIIGFSAVASEISKYLLGSALGGVEVLGEDDPLVHRLFQLREEDFTDGLRREILCQEFADWKDCFLIFIAQNTSPIASRCLDLIATDLGFTWLHASLDGPFILVGPTVVPGQTSNYHDFEKRIMMNMRELASYQRYKTALALGNVYEHGGLGMSPLLGLVASHAAIEAINWMNAGSNFTLGKVLSIYLPTMEIAFHDVLPVPGGADQSTSVVSTDHSLYFDVREWLRA